MGVAARRSRVRPVAALLAFQFTTFANAMAAQTRPAAIDAHPLGAPVAMILEFGDQYLGGDELYDAKVTVLEIARGEKAWNIVRQASASNPAPKAGFEYLLARVQFAFSARTSPSHYNYNLNETQFTATSASGEEFDAPSLVEQPTPRLNGTVKPGESVEGWVAFLVPRSVSKPLMVFREDVGTVSHRGTGTWFQLYTRPTYAHPAR
ncbi:MAG TPA: DUF4352 domain-containing protein [Candidatus Acidoferrum sp.]|nr:DUF4352 domain-containing protein [Candidatus Acidoferrum sp.]